MGITDDSPCMDPPTSDSPTPLSTQTSLAESASQSPTPNSTAPTGLDTPTSSIPTTDPAKQARDRRVGSLKSQVESLHKQLDAVLAEQEVVNSKLKAPTTPAATVQRHIHLLHSFNEIRDIAQGLLGLIAESRGMRVQDIYPEFGLDIDD